MAAKTANDVASLFLAQKLPLEKQYVQRWCAEILEAEALGEEAYSNLFLYQVCILGEMRTIISRAQSAWLYRMMANEKRYHKHNEPVVSYEGNQVGTWKYCESSYGDLHNRLTFYLQVDFVKEYMQPDSRALDIVVHQIEKDEVRHKDRPENNTRSDS